LWCIWF